jgi:hypothetical protein
MMTPKAEERYEEKKYLPHHLQFPEVELATRL